MLSSIRLLPALLFAPVALGAVEFNRDVRPILADKCFICHGPDAASKKVPFRLDREEFAFAALAGGRHAIVAGKPAESELIRRITSTNKGLRMPPAYSGLQLSDAETAMLQAWIQQGAPWEKHWSFIPPQRPTLPVVRKSGWTRNPIDNFILSRLERESLQPAPEAPREILLRRVSLDLTGLPPTPADLDAFLKDRSPNAWEKAVDRLLASPHYGERMAARWLDAARYADTNGYQFDGERTMWRWRDWVIDAFNRNMRYDQFTVEQLAGDLLPHPTTAQLTATGFNRNHRINTEDGIVPEEYFVEQVVDRLDTTSTVFMGLTLGCARCHNHKYDPLAQKEFYQFYSYFNNLPELGRGMKYGNTPPLIPAPTQAQQAKLDALNVRLRQKEAQLKVVNVAWEPTVGLQYRLSSPDVPRAPGKTGQAFAFDGKQFVDAGAAAAFDIEDPFSITTWIYADQIPDGSIASRMTDGLKGKGYGLHMDHGHVYANLTSVWADDAIRLRSERELPANEWHHIAMVYDGSRTAEGVTICVDGAPVKMTVETATLYRPFRNAGKAFKEPFRVGAGWGPARRFKGLLDDLRVYGRPLEPREVMALAALPAIPALSPQQLAIAREIEELKFERLTLERTFPTTMVMHEQEKPRETFLLLRGAYDKPGDRVERGLPAILGGLPKGLPNDRLGLAKWLVSGTHPLTARVMVNRLWQSIFGVGIVKTTEDFGAQGEWPTHPELLDWLATEFVRTGWDVKAITRLMVTSAAYRQNSDAMPDLLQRDPENRLLARGPRFRLSAEMIRDQALSAAGLLTTTIGGPSVEPYQPAGLWKETSMQDMDYVQSHGPDLYRRGIYTFWKRTIAPPMMMNFDAAGRETCVVRESRTNTPLQALDLMNDVTFVEAARMIGQRMLKEGGTDPADRLRYGFRLVTARYPTDAETQVLRRNLAFHLDYFAGNPGAAAKMIAQGEAPADPKLEPAQLAAYTSIGSLLLNLDEAVTKQ
jgi:mono/diheme cytochrome c family protein